MNRRKGLPATHPGALLREDIMPAMNLTQDRLAELIGVSRRTINEIVTEKRSVSADMAHRLARLLNTTPDLWLGLQQDVDLAKALEEGQEAYRKIKPITGMDTQLDVAHARPATAHARHR